jgi:ABC-type branched-subunit amino acid transport system substrate-binding protein
VLLVVLVLAAAACGARVSDEQQAAAVAGGTGGGAVAGGGGSSGGGTGDAGTADSGGTIGPGDAGGSGAASDGGTGTAGGGATGGGASTASGDNGGAVDVGATATEYTLGTVATLSGPVPGLFAGAVNGVQAFAAYVNSQGGIHGRKFKVLSRDDQFDAGQYRSQVQDLQKQVFAFVGSFSLYDDSGVPVIEAAGAPDVGVALSEARVASKANYSPAPNIAGGQVGPFNYLKKKFPNAVTAVGSIYSDVPASKRSHVGQKAAAESVGYRFIYERGFQATETDFTADVVRMRTNDVKMVYLSAADAKAVARFLQAMQRQNFKPEATVVYNTAYDAAFLPIAGSAADGVLNLQTQAMFLGEDGAVVPEVKLFNEWLQKVKPGAKPDLFTVYGWASGRLFVKALEAAGPKATRADVLAALRGIDDFDSNGLLGPAGPASRRPGVCFLPVMINGGKYQRFETPKGFRCDDGPFRRL